MTSTPELYTVVYKVKKDHHDAWWNMIRPVFLTGDKPIGVISVTRGDLVERVDQLETAEEKKGQALSDELATVIAQFHLGFQTLEVQNSDRLDFREVSVVGVKRALQAAFALGVEAGKRNTDK